MQKRILIAPAVLSVVLAACGGGSDAPASKTPDAKNDKGPHIACKEHPVVGKKAPELSMANMNGSGDIAVKPGKVTLIDFWATWCGPCQKSFPAYQALYTKYKANGLEIVAISVDDEDKKGEIPGFIKEHGNVKFPVGWDNGHPVAQCFDVQNMPTAFLVDKSGVVKFVEKGFKDNSPDEMEKHIKALL